MDQATLVALPESGAPLTLWGAANPETVITRAGAAAKVLADVIERQRMFATIGGRKHVTVEGWTTLGAMVGVSTFCTWTRKIDNGWEARVEARRSDGSTLAAAESQCDRGENTWATRDEHSLRSMAQTRATSKALGMALRFVVALAGYATTPAEEMPHEAAPPIAPPREVPAASAPTPVTGRAVSGQFASWPEANDVSDAEIVEACRTAVTALAQVLGISEDDALGQASEFTTKDGEKIRARSWEALTKKGLRWCRACYGTARSMLIRS